MMPTGADDGGAIPFCVRNTFLSTQQRQTEVAQPRSSSAEPRPSCDRYEQQVHALMYRARPVPKAVAPIWSSASGSASSAASDSTTMESDGEEGEDGASEVSQSSCADASGGARVSGGDDIDVLLSRESVEALIPRVPRDKEGNLSSIGSIPHAEGACRPCVFAHNERKACKNGIRCVFCHIPHPPKKRLRFCKKKRMEMKRQEEDQA